MQLQSLPTLPNVETTDLYSLALLLAEGQVDDIERQWDVFIDNLARITDAFAQARVTTSRRKAEWNELLHV